MIDICIKQHLRNIWSSIHEKVKQQRLSWKKSIAYKKSVRNMNTLLLTLIISANNIKKSYFDSYKNLAKNGGAFYENFWGLGWVLG